MNTQPRDFESGLHKLHCVANYASVKMESLSVDEYHALEAAGEFQNISRTYVVGEGEREAHPAKIVYCESTNGFACLRQYGRQENGWIVTRPAPKDMPAPGRLTGPDCKLPTRVKRALLRAEAATA